MERSYYTVIALSDIKSKFINLIKKKLQVLNILFL